MKLPVILSALFALSSGCDFVPSPPDEKTQKVDETYNSMNKALAAKDLPQFMAAYREAVAVKEQLKESGKQGSLSSQAYYFMMFNDLTQNYLGAIATKILSDPSILEDWPTNCSSLDIGARGLTQGLYRVNQSLSRLQKTVDSEDVPDRPVDVEKLLAYHDETIAASARDRKVYPATVLNNEARYFLDGTYTEVQFSTPANLMLYTLFTTQHSSISPLESTVKRDCGFIDLGLDGIDRCDARLNGIPDDETAIKAANEEAKECIITSLEDLK